MKPDLLVTGPVNPGGKGGGEVHHNYEVLTRLSKFGLEVVFASPPNLAAHYDEEDRRRHLQLLRELESAGVLVPSALYEVLEEGKVRGHSNAIALGSLLPRGVRSLALALHDVSLGLARGFYYPDGRLKEVYVRFFVRVKEEVGDVRALLHMSDVPSEFAITAAVFRRPAYLVFQTNPPAYRPTYLKVVSRFLTYEDPVTLLSFVPRNQRYTWHIMAYLRELVANATDLRAIWLNPATLVSYRRLAGFLVERLRENNFLYPGNSIDPLALEQRSYKKGDYLLFGGHFEPHKGLYDLPEILRRLRGRTDVKVVITGRIKWGKSSLPVIMRRLREAYPNVELLGFVEDRRELFKIYARARALIYPSHVDCHPLTVLDALGAGTPVVAYGIPELVYLYRGLRPVRLVREFDFDAFAEELARLAEVDNTEDLFDDEKVQEFIKFHGSWDNVAEQYAKALTR